ncbi:MAG: restriction endonuclease [Desulfuromonadales bacterium]|nr:restriction endonuclease [Desulfuromonadales bacterium]
MARNRTSPAEDLVEIISYLPWWFGCVLAVISYVGFHHYAGTEVPQPQGVGTLGDFAAKSLYVTFASFLQYLAPFFCLLGALISAIRNFKSKKRLATVAAQPHRLSLLDTSWLEFEELTAEYFKGCGYAVSSRGGNRPDGGVDLVVSKGSDDYLVQCKQWRANKVGVLVVRELYGVITAKGAAGGFVITSGQFTREAKKFADGLNVELFDGDRLHRMIGEVKRPAPKSSEGNLYESLSHPSHAVKRVCPQCGSEMVKRVARKGANAGGKFWGCSAFPKCRAVDSFGG